MTASSEAEYKRRIAELERDVRYLQRKIAEIRHAAFALAGSITAHLPSSLPSYRPEFHFMPEKELYFYRTSNGGEACTYDKNIYEEQKRKRPR